MRAASLLSLSLTLPLLLSVGGCGRQASPLASVADETPAQIAAPRRGPQVIVKFKATMRAADMQAFNQLYGTRQVDSLPTLNVYVLELSPDRDVDEALLAIRRSGYVVYAELNETISLRP